MRRRNAYRWTLFGLAAVLSACAGSPTPPAGPPGTVCRSFLPRDDKSLTGVLDSVSFGRYLSTLWEPAAGLTVASFRYDSVGAVDTAFVHSEAMTPSTKQRLSNSLAEFARPGGEARESVSLFLGDDAGPALRRVPELRTCQPELINERTVADMLMSEARGLLERNLLPDFGRRVTLLWMFVEPEGHVSEIRVEESAGRVEVDEAAVRIMRNARFNPARVEGIIVPVWVQIPIRFQVSVQPPPPPPPPPRL